MNNENRRQEIDQLRESIRLIRSRPFITGLFGEVEKLLDIGSFEAACAITEGYCSGGGAGNTHIDFALYLMNEAGKKACIRALEGDYEQSAGALQWLMNYGDESAINSIKKMLTTNDWRKRSRALRALGHMKANLVDIIPSLNDKEENVRLEAASQLAPREEKAIITHHAVGFVDFRTHQIDDELTKELCNKWKKPPPGLWNEFRGVGKWGAIPAIEKAILNEQSPLVLEKLYLTYVRLIAKYCPSDKIKQYTATVGNFFSITIRNLLLQIALFLKTTEIFAIEEK